MLGLESIFARSLLRNSSKCDLMWRWDADLKAAVHESRSACKQVREDTENGQKMKKTAKKRQKRKIIIGQEGVAKIPNYMTG